MSTPISAPVDLLRPVPAPINPAQAKTREQIKAASQDFEASFMSVMLGQMFNGVGEGSQFNGGEGEQMFKSFMMDAMSKKITRSGGVGLAHHVQTEMLKLQGLDQ